LCNQLDVAGIIAKNFKLIQTVFRKLALKDPRDQTQNIEKRITNFNSNYEIISSKDKQKLVKDILKLKVDQVINFDSKTVNKIYYQKMLPFVYSNLNKYDGLRFNNSNYLCHRDQKTIFNQKSSKLGNLVQARIIKGFELTNSYMRNYNLINI